MPEYVPWCTHILAYEYETNKTLVYKTGGKNWDYLQIVLTTCEKKGDYLKEGVSYKWVFNVFITLCN